MRAFELRAGRLVLAMVSAVLACSLLAAAAGAAGVRVKEEWMPAPAAPETPSSFTLKGAHLHNVNLNQVGVIKVGAKKAKNVLVFVPGTSGGGAYIVPFAKSLVQRLPGWQVWSVERRENLLEDQSMIAKAKRGLASPKQLFHYYLGYITEGGSPHMIQVPPQQVAFGQELGYERRRRRPPHGDRKGESARRQGRAVGPFARRLGGHRVLDLGLRRASRCRRSLGPRLRRRRQRPDADHPNAG